MKKIDIMLIVFLLVVFSKNICAQEEDNYKVMVDYNLTLNQLVDSGNYFQSSPNINEDNFPNKYTGKKEIDIKFFHFNTYIYAEDAIDSIFKAGFRPATIKELLALGAKYPGLQIKFNIIALGSIWKESEDGLFFPKLDNGGVGYVRCIRLVRFAGAWGSGNYFAAVCKSKD